MKFIIGIVLLALFVIPTQLVFSQPHDITMTIVFDSIKVHDDHDSEGFLGGQDDGEWQLYGVVNTFKNTGQIISGWGTDLSYPGSGMNDVRDGETVSFDRSLTSATVIVPSDGRLEILLNGWENDPHGARDDLGVIDEWYSGPPLLNGLGLHGSFGNICRESVSSTGDYTIKYFVDKIDGIDCAHVIPE